MIPPVLPPNEEERLKVLHELGLLDTPPEDRFDRITALLRDLLMVDVALVSLVDADRQWFKSRQGLEAFQTSRDVSFCGHAILQDEIFHVPDAKLDERFADNPLVIGAPHVRMYAGVPLKTIDGLSVGTLCVLDPHPRQMDSRQLRVLRDLGTWVEHEINGLRMESKILNLYGAQKDMRQYQERLLRVNHILSRLARVDGLTGVANRLDFDENLAKEFERAKRGSEYFSLIMADIDYFKAFNDRYGHMEGDECLRKVAKTLESCLDRPGDFVARIGGEEFTVVLPGADAEGAQKVANRCRETLLKAAIRHEDSPFDHVVTISLGVASLSPGHGLSPHECVERADQALYHSKRTGRNKVTHWTADLGIMAS